MVRKISDRLLSNGINNKGSSKAMSSLSAFGPKEAAMFAQKMIETESRGNGDQMNAMERVAKRCGVTSRQLRRFLAGDIKRPGWDLIQGIHVGFFGLLESKVKALQHEIEVCKTRYGSAHFEDLDDQTEALVAEVETRKKGITQ